MLRVSVIALIVCVIYVGPLLLVKEKETKNPKHFGSSVY